MKPAINRVGNTLEFCGAALLVAVSLPFVALTLVLLRAVFLAVAVGGILSALVLFCAHSPFRGWVAAHARGTGPAHS